MIKKTILSVAALLTISALSAQAYSDYDNITGRDFWLRSLNPASAVVSGAGSAAKAEAYGGKQNGDFRDSYESPDSYDYGVRAEAYRIMRDGTRFFGGMDYNYFRGKRMCGSMFTLPGEFPIDIVEFTPGIKIRENYNIYGSFAQPLGEHWTIGGALDYTSSNYAKRKDLRHKNTKMDLDAKAGVGYAKGGWFVGLSGMFRRQTEKLTAEEIGNLGITYDAFLNKGNWYGAGGLWTDSGIHLQETGLKYYPIAENTLGAALQAQLNLFRTVTVRNELSARRSKGATGERGIVWNDFGRFAAADRLEMRAVLLSTLNTLRGSVEYSELYNREAVSGRETVNGVTQVMVYGYNRIYTERNLSANAEYEIALGPIAPFTQWSAPFAKWILRCGVDFVQKSGISSLMYPVYKNRYYTIMSPYGSVQHNLAEGRNLYSLSAAYRYAAGTGRRDKSYKAAATDMILGPYADYLDTYARYDWEYLLAERHTGSVEAKYGRMLGGRSRRQLYLKIDYSLVYCTERLHYVGGPTRHLIGAAVGLEF